MISNRDELPRNKARRVVGFYLAVYAASFEGTPDPKVPTDEAITGDVVDRALSCGASVLPMGETQPSARDVSRVRKQLDEQRAAEAKAEKAKAKADAKAKTDPPPAA